MNAKRTSRFTDFDKKNSTILFIWIIVDWKINDILAVGIILSDFEGMD